MNNIEISQVKALDHELAACPSRTLQCACMLRTMAQGTGTPSDGPLYDAFARLAGRILDMLLSLDEPRYSTHDYADAVANARDPVSPEKLMALDDDAFAAAMVWLATDKRETYEEAGHAQAALELDIWG